MEHAVAVIRRQTAGADRICMLLVSTGGTTGRLVLAPTPRNSCDTDMMTSAIMHPNTIRSQFCCPQAHARSQQQYPRSCMCI